jgi:3-hydroxyisobutyrate dehydrogenase-like beta-hydroxyacid dehydrogenase
MLIEKNHQPIGIIGLGAMGSALAANLVKNNVDIKVWNRSIEKCRPLEARGVPVAKTVHELVSSCKTIIVCLFDHRTTMDLLTPKNVSEALNEKILIQLTTIRETEMTELTSWATTHKIRLLKGDILTLPYEVEKGVSTTLYAGPRSEFDEISYLVNHWGQSIHVSDKYDVAVQLASAYSCFLYPLLIGFIQAAAVCSRSQISIQTYYEIMSVLLRGSTISGMLENITKAIEQKSYANDSQGSLEMWSDGLKILVDDMNNHKLNISFIQSMKTIMEETIKSGDRKNGIGSIFEFFTKK